MLADLFDIDLASAAACIDMAHHSCRHFALPGHLGIAELFRSLACGRSDDRFGLSLTTEIAIRPVRTCDRSESRYPVACDAPVPFCGWKQCSSFALHQCGSSRLRRLGHLFSLDRDHEAWEALRQNLRYIEPGEGGVEKCGERGRVSPRIHEVVSSRRSGRFLAKSCTSVRGMLASGIGGHWPTFRDLSGRQAFPAITLDYPRRAQSSGISHLQLGSRRRVRQLLGLH